MYRKYIRRFTQIILIFGFLAAAANIVIDNPYVHRLVRAIINEKLERKGVHVDFESLSLQVFPPGADLYALRLVPADDHQETIISVSYAHLNLSLWSLFLGKIKVGLLELTGANVALPLAPDVHSLLFESSGSESEPEPFRMPRYWDVPLDELRIRDMGLTIDLRDPQDDDQGMFLAASGLNLELDIDSRKHLTVALQSKSTHLILDGNSLLEEADFSFAATATPEGMAIENLRVTAERGQAKGSAKVEFVLGHQRIFMAATTKGQLEVDADFSILGSYLDVKETGGRATGLIDLDIEIPVEGNDAFALMIKGPVQLEDGRLDGFELFDSKAELSISKNGITLSNLSMHRDNTEILRGDGRIAFDDELNLAFTAQPQSLRFLDLMASLGVDLSIVDFAIESTLVSVKGQGFPFFLDIAGMAVLSDFDLPDHPIERRLAVESPACEFSLQIKVDASHVRIPKVPGQCHRSRADLLQSRVQNSGAATDASDQQEGRKIELALDAKIGFDQQEGLELKIAVSDGDLVPASYFAQIPIDGRFTGDVRVFGPYDNVQVAVGFKAQNASLGPVQVDRVRSDLVFDAKKVQWHELHAEFGAGRIQSRQGQLTYQNHMAILAEARFENVSKATIEQLFFLVGIEKNVVGFAVEQGTLKYQGELLRPFTAAIDGQLVVQNLKIEGESILDQARFSIKSTAGGADVQMDQARRAQFLLLGQLAYRRKAKIQRPRLDESELAKFGFSLQDSIITELSVETTDQVDTARTLNSLPVVGPYLSPMDLAGDLQIKAKLQGRFNALNGVFEMRLNRGSLLGSPMAPLEVRAFLASDRLDTVMNYAGDSLSGRLTLELKPGLPFEWYMSFTRLDLGFLGGKFFSSDPRNFAYLTGDWTLYGQFRNWWASRGSFKLKDFRARLLGAYAAQSRIDIASVESVEIEMTPKVWRLKDNKKIRLTGDGISVALDLKEMRLPDQVGIEVESTIEVQTLKQLTDEIEVATGMLVCRGNVSGSIEEPRYSFEISDLRPNARNAGSWEPVSLGLKSFRPELRTIQLKAKVDNTGIEIEEFRADKGAGQVLIAGKISMNDSQGTSQLTANFREASVIFPMPVLKTFESVLSGTVTLVGNRAPFRLIGELKIDRGRASRDFDVRNEIVSALRRSSYELKETESLPLLELDLSIISERSIIVKNRNMQASLSSHLRISGTDAHPLIQGQVEVDRGKFNYKRDFEVVRGVMSFDDAVNPDPALDVLARSDFGDHQVYISITGHVSEPQIDLSIEPATREDGTPISTVDILVLLSRGSLPDNDRVVGDTFAEGLNVFAGQQVEEQLSRLIELSGQDVITHVYIDAYASEETGAPVARVNLPLKLVDGLDLVLRVDDNRQWRASFENPIHDNISISGFAAESEEESESVGANPEVNLNLNLKFRFSYP